MPDVFNVTTRTSRGTSNARRERKSGTVPAVLYGHGKENVSLSIPSIDIDAAMRHNSQLVSLRGAVNEDALIKEVQWDTFGNEVLHLDLARVDASELVEVTLTVELRGEAPGTKQGGVVQQPIHELQLSCPAAAIPDKLELKVNTLQLGESLTAAQVPLPEGATLVTGADDIIVQCVEAAEEQEVEADAGPAEPEVIGRKKGEGDEEAGDE